ncbi:DNA-binding protein HEXBP-like [Gordionus sp. m RMFG-2023]|uniref:DNA-binding protein HEXBP-like n=1 Tax=Gordionus sp. m RMFG-2023 TaxID=3053472 RepID=UPI0031FBFCC0
MLPVVCKRCENRGHNAEECYVPAYKLLNEKQKNTDECESSGKFGHNQDKCYKNQQGNSKAFPFPAVEYRKNEGNNIYEKRNVEDITCFKCRNIGHYAKDCTSG